jgi:hypothetical protein
MCGDAGDVQAATCVLEERRRLHAPAERGVEVEEVRRDDALGLGGEELAPGGAGPAGRGADAGGVEDLPYGAGGDRMAEASRFPLDAAVPHPGSSPARRTTSLFSTAAVGGRPKRVRRWLQPHFSAIIRRCQAGTVPGVTGNTCAQRRWGISDDSTANQTRSAGS